MSVDGVSPVSGAPTGGAPSTPEFDKEFGSTMTDIRRARETGPAVEKDHGSPPSSQWGTFTTQDQAAKAALNLANPLSVAENREYAGLIYREPNGRYNYTLPLRGDATGSHPWSAPLPPGAVEVGWYHTHGDYSLSDPSVGPAMATPGVRRTSSPMQDGFNSDNFAPMDVDLAEQVPNSKAYLGTPSGQFKVYNPSTGGSIFNGGDR